MFPLPTKPSVTSIASKENWGISDHRTAKMVVDTSRTRKQHVQPSQEDGKLTLVLRCRKRKRETRRGEEEWEEQEEQVEEEEWNVSIGTSLNLTHCTLPYTHARLGS